MTPPPLYKTYKKTDVFFQEDVPYCTLSLTDLWATRQDNQNKYPMVNTKII